MARITKTLEEQLQEAQKNLETSEAQVRKYKKKITDINKKIDDRDMKRAFLLLQKKGMSVDQLEKILNKK